MGLINKQAKIRCQWCQFEFTAEKWNDTTFKECKSREMRRAFKSIFDTKRFAKDSQNFYKCPHCDMWSRGNQLILLDDNGEVIKGIGGSPVMKLTDKDI